MTGRQGQLARALAHVAADDDRVNLSTISRPEADLARPGSMGTAIRARRADLVINAAAYTAVDAAESDAELAHRINAAGAGEVAEAAAAIGADFIQISTDYVFNGRDAPYQENDPTDPLNVYGLSKRTGEILVLESNPNALIIRTGWVVSPWGHNFLKTMLRLSREHDEIAVVDDQYGRPTSAIDLALALLQVATKGSGGASILHLTGSGEASWADLAEEVLSVSNGHGVRGGTIRRIATKDYPTPARRPLDTRLDNQAAADLGFCLPDWRISVRNIVAAIVQEAKLDRSG